MNIEKVKETFLLATKGIIEPDSDDAISIGTMSVSSSLLAEGVFLVMEKYTQYIDQLIQHTEPKSIERFQLYTLRGFTYQEFTSLYDFTIKPKDFIQHPIFKCLFVTTERQRKRYMALYPDKTHEHYMAVLQKALLAFHPSHFLVHFFFEVSAYRSYLYEKNVATALSYSGCIRSREK